MKIKYNLIPFLVTALLTSGCVNKPAAKNDYQDPTATEDALESNLAKLDDAATDVKPTAPKAMPPGAEDSMNQTIKKQSEADIVKAANDLLIVNPTNLKALNALGLSNYKKGKYKAAEYFLNKALKAHSTEPGLYNNLALVKLAQNEQRDAIKLLKAGLVQKSNDIALLTNLGSIYATQKDYANAVIALEPVYKNSSKDFKIAANYAVSLAGTKKFPEATKVYEKLLSDNGSSREIMLNFSIHLIENVQNYKQGLDLINRLKFVGVPDEARNVIKELEIKAKAVK